MTSIPFKAKAQSACPIVPFAVVELFTSQGCGYCPAAGNSLDSIILAEKTSGRNVICIAEHVQYGSAWTDTYKDAQFSPRQTVYCQYVGVPKGTPECFVNGKLIAAPDPRTYTINPLINNQLGAGNLATAGVCLTMQSAVNNPTLIVGYTVSGNITGANLIVCLIEDGTIVTPTAGENQGRTIHESGVSRNFVVTPINGNTTGTVTITPPANCVRTKSQIVAYVQNPTSMYIRGATRGIDLGLVSTGVQNLDKPLGISVYPNPAISTIYINYLNYAAKGDATISLTDLSGRLVYSENIINTGTSGEFFKAIDVSTFAKGVYILNFVTDAETIYKKVIVE